MRTGPAVAVALALLLESLALAYGKVWDVSTDEGVRAAMRAVADVDLEAMSLGCTRRFTDDFRHVVLVATFVHDFGCASKGYFVDGQYVASREEAGPALRSAGWSDRGKRVALARAWVDRAIYAEPLRAGQDDRSPAPATLGRDGGVVIEGWHTRPPGMRPVRVDSKVRVTFSADGAARVAVISTTETPLR